ncbi:MAG: metallophosphoesterase family protein [Clostridia bacterium]|nr:metallophosphoesterase family protein [Clostridia bacterium]
MIQIKLFFSRLFRSLGCILLLLTVLAEGWLVFGVRINSDPPVVREYAIESDKIDQSVTLVMLSDLHGCDHPTLTDQIAEIDPDLILMCGDMINHQHATGEDILVTAAVVKELSDIAPVYYSYGNHELERIGLHDRRALDPIIEAGAILLEREYEDLEINGNSIRLGGIYTPNSAETAKPDASSCESFFANFTDTKAFTVLMEHRPAAVTDTILPCGFEPDLCLSGHLHGGHVILPLLGPVYGANSGFFPDYALGKYEFGKSTLIVSAGLSTERHIIPRINNPTEITKIILE